MNHSNLVAPRDHPLSRKRKIGLHMLAEHELIFGEMNQREAYRWRLGEIYSSEGLTMKVALEASNPMTLLGLVAAGMGVTIYPESLTGFVGERLSFRQIDDHRFRLQTILAWKRSTPSKSVRAFVALARQPG